MALFPTQTKQVKIDTASGTSEAYTAAGPFNNSQRLRTSIYATNRTILNATAISSGSGIITLLYVGGGGTYFFVFPELTSASSVTVTYTYIDT